MKRIAVLFAFACVLATAACGGDDKKPPLTPDSDKPADLADAGPTTTSVAPPK
jgi:predicted small lipoprotein YifL